MYEMVVIILDQKPFLFMQSFTSWKKFSAQTYRLEYHYGCLMVEARLDLQWWLTFLPCWSGRSLILDSHWTLNATMQLFTGTSGCEGWGAYWSCKWFQDQWSLEQQKMSIA